MEEKYFVASEGGGPVRIYFCSLDAFISGYLYLDSFDESGSLLSSFKLIDNEYCVINGIRRIKNA